MGTYADAAKSAQNVATILNFVAYILNEHCADSDVPRYLITHLDQAKGELSYVEAFLRKELKELS